MTKKRQPLRAAAAAPSKEKEGGTKRQKVEDSSESRSKTTKSSSSSKQRDDDGDEEDGDEDGDDDEDDDDEDDDIALEGQLHFTEPITFEFNDPKEEYAESITVLLKQVDSRYPLSISYFLFQNQILPQLSITLLIDKTVCTKSNESLFIS